MYDKENDRYKIQLDDVLWIPPYAEKRIDELLSKLADEFDRMVVGLESVHGKHASLSNLGVGAESLDDTAPDNAIDVLEDMAERIEDARSELGDIVTENEDRMMMYMAEIMRMHRASIKRSLMEIHQQWLNDPQH